VNFSPEKIFVVGLLALLVLGPNRLPQAARTAGKMMAEFRRMSASLQNEVTAAISEPRDALNQAVGEFGLGDLHSTISDVRGTLRSAVTEVVTGAPTGQTRTAVGGAVGAPAVLPDPVDAMSTSAASLASPPPPDDPSLN
jgi:sec-independent protein translocase protein TatB